jgi:hypothetical protein
MTEASRCVVCDGEIRTLKRAMVAPFLATRIWGRRPFNVDLAGCNACGFMFYNPRLDSADEGRLYSGYRSEEYQRMRHSSEPWYTEDFNVDLASAASYEVRRRTVAGILSQHLGGRKIRRVLDYGGDRGDLVCGLIEGADAFVYDISGIPAAERVAAVTDARACKADLIVNSNVLEHVGFPRQLMAEMFGAAPKGGLVFLEVPCETPFGLARLARRVAQVGVMSVAHPSLSTSIVRPSALYMMHEHINYFSEQSLRTLLHAGGGEVVASGSYPMDGRAGKGVMVWCLGSVN